MTADFRRGKKGKGQFRFKKEKFQNPNDIPLGPRVPSEEATWQNLNLESSEGGKKKGKWDGGAKGRSKKPFKEEVKFNPKSKKTQDERKEIERLNSLLENGPHKEPSEVKSFKDFPLSKKTMMGLRDSEYEEPTEVQKESIGLALRGFDILGAAKTGSGKTLAFLIPVLEKLYRNLWTKVDGLGAVIITPTRELAYQIFEALRKVGRYHDFSAGLIIGGKDLKFERKRMDQMNIVICTPGRLLQHMDENASFSTTNVQILVLDEADRCLDMGFEREMNAILGHLPEERQTLLFSATQTKSVKDLARLSLKSPVYVSVHENSEYSTPETLQQSYVVCPLESKLNMLWSFIKHHRKSKILVFMSSCKQVRFVHMLFCRMRPGTSLLALHGSMHQLKRMATYDEFCKKQAVVLFATDIAARGLDFPVVDWVLQLDCPEDATTYIHRAGRTARLNKGGEALLVLLPSEEEAMISELRNKRIPIEKIEVNTKRMVSVTRKFEALLARDTTLKECAQRAFKAYLKSVFLMKNKNVFDVSKLDLPDFARSLGLAVAPRLRFLEKRGVVGAPGQSGKMTESGNEEMESDTEDDNALVRQKVIEPSKSAPTFDFHTADDDEDIDSLFTGKKPAEVGGDDDDEDYSLEIGADQSDKKPKKVKTKAQVAKKLLKKKIQVNRKVVFDEEGEAVPDVRKEKQSELAKSYEMEDVPGIDVEKAKLALKEEDQYDKQLFRAKVKARHKEERRKAKLARKGLAPEDLEEKGEDEEGPRIKTEKEDDDESDEYEPNLDWLPDPDKIYGKGGNEEEGESSEEEEEDDSVSDDDSEEGPWCVRGNKRHREVVNTDDSESEDEEEDDDEDEDEPPPKKRMVGGRGISKPSDKSSKVKNEIRNIVSPNIDKNLMEDLALQLLRSKR